MKVNKHDVINDLTLTVLSDWLKGARWPVALGKVCCVCCVVCHFPNSITTTQKTCCGLVSGTANYPTTQCLRFNFLILALYKFTYVLTYVMDFGLKPRLAD